MERLVAGFVGIGIAHADVDLARVVVVTFRNAGWSPAVAGHDGMVAI